MDNSQAQIQDLHRRYLANALSAEETEQFFLLVREPANEAILKEYMDGYWDKQFDGITYKPTPGRLLPVWFRTMAAAILLLVVGGILFQLAKKQPAQLPPQAERFKNDVQPGTNKAILKLADGSVINLDSAGNGHLATQGRTQVTSKNGTLYYDAHTSGLQSILYNDMITPVGGQYKLTLADGTVVWLDASSSIHFPTAFPGAAREVKVTGQAYFEVAKDATKPFRVKVKDQVVEVLGTHFNVNAYDDETGIKTTLSEGSVKVVNRQSAIGNASARQQSVILKPGQQASLSHESNKSSEIQVQTADMEEMLAWKNGLFRFNGANIETIMKQVARWYGVSIVYESHVKEQFVVDIPREVPLSRMLALLELTRQVHFKIEGTTVTVIP